MAPCSCAPSSFLADWFFGHSKGPGIHKWLNYFEIYDRLLHHLRDAEVNILEIGVQSGGAAQMWLDYFGPRATYYGLDVSVYAKSLFDCPPRVNIWTGDQANRTFLQELSVKLPLLDVIVDDGGHTMEQQITSFEELFPLLKNGGVYIVEDVSTSYVPGYGGGDHNKTFMAYAQALTHDVNRAFASRMGFLADNLFHVGFFEQIVYFERRMKNSGEATPVMRQGSFWVPYIINDNVENATHLEVLRDELKSELNGGECIYPSQASGGANAPPSTTNVVAEAATRIQIFTFTVVVLAAIMLLLRINSRLPHRVKLQRLKFRG